MGAGNNDKGSVWTQRKVVLSARLLSLGSWHEVANSSSSSAVKLSRECHLDANVIQNLLIQESGGLED